MDIDYQSATGPVDDEGWITLQDRGMRFTSRVHGVAGCPVCGALVFDTYTHTEWHESLSQQG